MCLDNDEAGIAAVERVCSSGMLASVEEKSVTEIRIATLPYGIKDPAEFVESRKSKNATNDFRSLVIDSSVEWTDWYLKQTMSRYNSSALRGSPGSFSDIFEKAANFLATFTNAADRTERACQVASGLADVMSIGDNGSKASDTVRVQLESDLFDKVSSIVKSKEAITSRLESLGGGSKAEIRSQLTNIARGVGSSGGGDLTKLSSKAIRSKSGARSWSPSDMPISGNKTSVKTSHSEGRQRWSGGQGRRYRARKTLKRTEPSLTPHVSGVNFANENDASWVQSINVSTNCEKIGLQFCTNYLLKFDIIVHRERRIFILDQ